jgi:hypothetical protein
LRLRFFAGGNCAPDFFHNSTPMDRDFAALNIHNSLHLLAPSPRAHPC